MIRKRMVMLMLHEFLGSFLYYDIDSSMNMALLGAIWIRCLLKSGAIRRNDGPNRSGRIGETGQAIYLRFVRDVSFVVIVNLFIVFLFMLGNWFLCEWKTAIGE